MLHRAVIHFISRTTVIALIYADPKAPSVKHFRNSFSSQPISVVIKVSIQLVPHTVLCCDDHIAKQPKPLESLLCPYKQGEKKVTIQAFVLVPIVLFGGYAMCLAKAAS